MSVGEGGDSHAEALRRKEGEQREKGSVAHEFRLLRFLSKKAFSLQPESVFSTSGPKIPSFPISVVPYRAGWL